MVTSPRIPSDHAGPPPVAEPLSSAAPDARLLAAVLDSLPTAVLVKDVGSARYVFANTAGAGLLARPRDAIMGRTDEELEHDGSTRLDPAARLPAIVRGTAPPTLAFRIQQRVVESAGRAPCSILIGEDVTCWIDAEEELKRRADRDPLTSLLNRNALDRALTALIAARTPLALMSIDLDQFKAINDRHGHLAGDTVLQEVADRLAALVGGGDVLARIGGDEFMVVVVGDRPDARAADLAERILAELAKPPGGHPIGASIGVALFPTHGGQSDALRRHADTALYQAKRSGRNRCCFFDGDRDLATRPVTADTDGTPPGSMVCIIEIDRFASLRQRIGFAVANGIVDQLATRVGRLIPGCRLGRIGRTSVEFAFAIASADSARATLGDLAVELERPVDIDGYTFDLKVSIGAADSGHEVIDDRQLDAAAAALALAVERREKVVVADAASRDGVGVEQLSIVRDLRRALAADQLALHYQPKLRCRTETIDSAEALLRWHHPEHGLIRTDLLIDIAEITGAIRDLTFWVIDRAIADQARLVAGGRPMTLYVNISGQLLADRGFAAWALARLAPLAGAIGFEITETAVIAEPAVAIEHLRQFSAAGIRIAIDDYGSGLSSLAYLKQLPAHELKIDRMFVSGLTESHRDPLLVRSSIDLAHALEMEVTAEGVDDPISLSLLRVMGCDLVQGYLVSPPLPIDAFEAFLRQDRYRAAPGAAAPTLHGWNLAGAIHP